MRYRSLHSYASSFFIFLLFFFTPLWGIDSPAHCRLKPKSHRIYVEECLPCGYAYQEATQACRLTPVVTLGLIIVVAAIAVGLAHRTSSSH